MRNALDQLVRDCMTAQGLASVSIGIRRAGMRDVTRSYGFADLENDVRATPHTVYRIGSLTKQFTAAATMRLVERGTLGLDDTLAALIPGCPAHVRHITVEQLLTHTSGIKNYTEIPAFAEKSRLDLTQSQLGELIANEPLEFVPGERYKYSNSGYFLLGVIIEQVSGKPYHQFMQEEVFTPLGLLETYYLDNYRIIKRRAHGYDIFQGYMVNSGYVSMTSPFAAGALGSTVVDLLEWQTALLGGRVIGLESLTRMATPARLADGTRTAYGFGMETSGLDGRPRLSHGGTINGFRSQLAYYPDEGAIVVVLCNNGGADVEQIERRIVHNGLER